MSVENAGLPPLKRGQYETQDGSLDSYLGKRFTFADYDYSPSTYTQAAPLRSSKFCHCLLVQNSSAGALLPGQAVTWKAGTLQREVDGLARLTAGRVAGFVDEWLPSTGVPAGAYFFISVKGPAKCLTSLAGNAENVITADSTKLVALAAATSGATTAGRVVAQDLTGSSQLTDYTTIANQVANAVGVAMSSKTTGQTNDTVLVDLFDLTNI